MSLAAGEKDMTRDWVGELVERYRFLAASWADDETRRRLYTMVADELEVAIAKARSSSTDTEQPEKRI